MSDKIPGANATDESGNGSRFISDCLAGSTFDYLTDNDTDTENSTLPPTRRWAWYCKLRTCPKYYSSWLLKTNFLLHLWESPVHRADATTATREGRRQLARAWREETAFDLSEPRKSPPEDGDEAQEGGKPLDRTALSS